MDKQNQIRPVATWLLFAAFVIYTGCAKKETDKNIQVSREAMDRISSESGVQPAKIEELGIAMDEALRRCNRRFARKPRLARQCMQAGDAQLMRERGIDARHLNEIKKAHVNLKWELKHFTGKYGTPVKTLKKIFALCMEHHQRCEKKIQALKLKNKEQAEQRTEHCADRGIESICRRHKFNVEQCGKIISMGIDYGWRYGAVESVKLSDPKED